MWFKLQIKFIAFLLCILFIPLNLLAQSNVVKDVDFVVENSMLNITYKLTPETPSSQYLVTTQISLDNGINYFKPKNLFGDVGKVSTFGIKNIYWDVFKDIEEIDNKFCNWLSKKTGRVIRLPEEDEWEFAARGGKKSKRYYYSGSDELDEVGWYNGNSGGKTHEVRKKKPNELGIYDMSGNVWEWAGTKGYIRGGSWGNDSNSCSVSRGSIAIPRARSNYIGFRVLQNSR
ncbi:MAG: SUMF1/EgtB/PvdO family nonheme iron enzyme [Bacteroidetes bacterium]|nr:SUMF1/EgtB/PvdO family nonheme iron enzyme [Bacteroidota bacterium]